jgi:hypothetical protein
MLVLSTETNSPGHSAGIILIPQTRSRTLPKAPTNSAARSHPIAFAAATRSVPPMNHNPKKPFDCCGSFLALS